MYYSTLMLRACPENTCDCTCPDESLNPEIAFRETETQNHEREIDEIQENRAGTNNSRVILIRSPRDN